jgi:hypothetical protein
MAYDTATGNMVLFGGTSSGALGDTWTWNGVTWTKQTPASSPTARSVAAMAYDPATRDVVLFGGAGAHGGLGDTWTWNGTTWTKLSPATSPTPLASASMAYDTATGNMVLFGGGNSCTGSCGYLASTWTWNGTTWTKLSPATSPPARTDATMAYDSATGDMVLFGGGAFSGYLNTTWTWNGMTWAQASPSAIPTARATASMAYDPATEDMVLFGGGNSQGNLGDTWTWNGVTWTKQSPAASPVARYGASMAYDPASGNMLLFGGISTSGYLNDTWTYGHTVSTLSITTTSLPSATVGTPYSAQLSATGGTTPYKWSIRTGSLPPGLTLDATTGAITGTPTPTVSTAPYTATYDVGFTVTDANTVKGTATLSIAEHSAGQPTITTTSLPTGTFDTPYTAQLSVRFSNAPYHWSVSSGTLPKGLSLDATTGGISGTPTSIGTTKLTFKVTGGNKLSRTRSLSITVKRATPTTPRISNLPASGTDGGGFTATVSTNGDGAKSVTSNSTNVCTASGLAVKYVGVGTCSLTAHVGAGTDYNAANGTAQTVTVNAAPPPAKSAGYDMVGRDGGVFVFPTGQSGGFFGSLPGITVHVNNIVGMVPTSTDQGYFLVGSDGGVFAFGNAPFLGSLPGLKVTPSQPITGIVAANTDKGYFLVGRDGGVFAFGTVPFLGSLPGRGISVDNIIGIASTPSGNGYWLVSATGTVYGFGAAQQLGTAKGTSSPVSAIAGTPTGGGYWITTQNGAVHAFGNAKGFGTLPALGVNPALPVIGVVHTADTAGYWLIGADGGIFAFGDAGFVGSLPGVTVHVTDVVGAVPTEG